MNLSSMISLSPRLRTNAVFCLLFFVFCSLQSIISSVKLMPKEEIKAMWNIQNAYITCSMDKDQQGGTVQWFRGSSNHPIDDNTRAPVYVRVENPQTVKIFFSSPGKKYSDTYECRHIRNGKLVSAGKVALKVFKAIDMSPEIGNKLSHVGTEGSSFTMPCTARFDKDARDDSISWRHNNQPINNIGRDISYQNTNYESSEYKEVKSMLKVHRLSKDHEGVYTCQSDYANDYLTDVKEIDITLRVQFKPRFLEKNHRNVWISDDSSGLISVNVTCLVNADPVATFTWSTSEGTPIPPVPGQGRPIHNMPNYTIVNTENMSVLSLNYSNINQIQSNFNDPENRKKNFKCQANNRIGDAKQDFIISIGKLPDPPSLGHTSYDNGILSLSLNQSEVKPSVDMYRVDIDDSIPIYFNDTNRVEAANNTYKVEVDVPTGTYQLTLYAHNPVGWSPKPNKDQAIIPHKLVINGAAVAQQYLATLLMASALALRYAL